MFEGNEINFLRKKQIDLKELVLLSTPEDCDNFQRTEILLDKQNKVQVLAALNTDNLRQLIRENPSAFANKILPIITQKVPHMKDTDMQQHTAGNLEEIVGEQPPEDKQRGKAWLTLCETLMELLTAYNKKSLDEIWMGLIMKIIEVYAPEEYVDTALEYVEQSNAKSLSTQRLALNMLVKLITRFPHRFTENGCTEMRILLRSCQDMKSDIRCIAAAALPQMTKLSQAKLRPLEELKELIDDEDSQVKLTACEQLSGCLNYISDASDLSKSGILPAIRQLYSKSASPSAQPSFELQQILAEQSVKVLWAVRSACDIDLQKAVLTFYQKAISTLEKCTPESLQAELGMGGSSGEESSGSGSKSGEGKQPNAKLTFLEQLASGSLDLAQMQDDQLQEERKDSAAEVRMLITRCFPAFLMLLKQEPNGLNDEPSSTEDNTDQKISNSGGGQPAAQNDQMQNNNTFTQALQSIQEESEDTGVYKPVVLQLIKQFRDLRQDSNFMIRFSCSMVLSKMCEIVQPRAARTLFTEDINASMKDPNPQVLIGLYEGIETIVKQMIDVDFGVGVGQQQQNNLTLSPKGVSSSQQSSSLQAMAGGTATAIANITEPEQQQFIQGFTKQWIKNFNKVVTVPGHWRLLKIHYEKTLILLPIFTHQQCKQMIPNLIKTAKVAIKPLHKPFIALIIELLKTPNLTVRQELIDQLQQNLAYSPHSQCRLLFLDLCHAASDQLSKNLFQFVFGTGLTQAQIIAGTSQVCFGKDQNLGVISKFCDIAVVLAFCCDYDIQTQGGLKYRHRAQNLPPKKAEQYESIDKVLQQMIKTMTGFLDKGLLREGQANKMEKMLQRVYKTQRVVGAQNFINDNITDIEGSLQRDLQFMQIDKIRDKASNLPQNKFEKIGKSSGVGMHGYSKSNKSEMKGHNKTKSWFSVQQTQNQDPVIPLGGGSQAMQSINQDQKTNSKNPFNGVGNNNFAGASNLSPYPASVQNSTMNSIDYPPAKNNIQSKPPSRSKVSGKNVTQVESKSQLAVPPKHAKLVTKSNPSSRKVSTQDMVVGNNSNILPSQSKANDLIQMVTNDLIARAQRGFNEANQRVANSQTTAAQQQIADQQKAILRQKANKTITSGNRGTQKLPSIQHPPTTSIQSTQQNQNQFLKAEGGSTNASWKTTDITNGESTGNSYHTKKQNSYQPRADPRMGSNYNINNQYLSPPSQLSQQQQLLATQQEFYQVQKNHSHNPIQLNKSGNNFGGQNHSSSNNNNNNNSHQLMVPASGTHYDNRRFTLTPPHEGPQKNNHNGNQGGSNYKNERKNNSRGRMMAGDKSDNADTPMSFKSVDIGQGQSHSRNTLPPISSPNQKTSVNNNTSAKSRIFTQLK